MKDAYTHPVTRPLMLVADGITGAGILQVALFWLRPFLVLTGLCYLAGGFSIFLFAVHLWKARVGLK